MSSTLISSPLQGYTEFRFRNTFHKHFSGIDYYYAPYIRLSGTKEIKNSYKRDLLPENNPNIKVVPQLMCKQADDFLQTVAFVQEMGYKELNWNLGCPYPMVTKRGMGAGLIKDATCIVDILQRVKLESDIDISLKLRLGNESPNEIIELLPQLESLTIKNICIHPRIGKQLYKGTVDLEAFERCLELSSHTIIYNGDITSVQKFKELQERFPTINNWMIGRGIITDPFLPGMIKENTATYPSNANEIFSNFHEKLFQEYAQALSGDKHLLIKMTAYWEYFSLLFSNAHKCYKKIKKAQHLTAYKIAVSEIIRNESIVGFK